MWFYRLCIYIKLDRNEWFRRLRKNNFLPILFVVALNDKHFLFNYKTVTMSELYSILRFDHWPWACVWETPIRRRILCSEYPTGFLYQGLRTCYFAPWGDSIHWWRVTGCRQGLILLQWLTLSENNRQVKLITLWSNNPKILLTYDLLLRLPIHAKLVLQRPRAHRQSENKRKDGSDGDNRHCNIRRRIYWTLWRRRSGWSRNFSRVRRRHCSRWDGFSCR